MTKSIVILVVSVVFLVGCTKGGPKDIALKTDGQKVSYAIGQQIGNGLKAQGIKADSDVIAMSISDVLAGKDPRLSQPEMQAALQSMQKKMMARHGEDAKKHKGEGEAFLVTNKKKKGIKATKSGLQYEVIKAGKGPSPKKKDRVKVHYRGKLIDGKEFDSSYKRDKPAEFFVERVVKGWTEALQMMKVGGKWKIYVPSALGYGERGAPPNIPPNAVLIFDIELLEIVTDKKPPIKISKPKLPTKKAAKPPTKKAGKAKPKKK